MPATHYQLAVPAESIDLPPPGHTTPRSLLPPRTEVVGFMTDGFGVAARRWVVLESSVPWLGWCRAYPGSGYETFRARSINQAAADHVHGGGRVHRP